MKRFISFCAAMALIIGASAQVLPPRSVVKTNVVSLGTSLINVHYEYKVSPKNSVGIVPAVAIPRTWSLEATGTSSNTNDLAYKGEVTTTGFSVTPYFRFYGEAMTGWYFETFLKYYDYEFTVPYDYQKNNKDVVAEAEGTATAFGGGVAFGKQIVLGSAFVMDFFVGAGYSVGSAHAETADPNLDAQDYADIKAEMDALEDVSILIVGDAINNMTYDANSTSAWADIEGYTLPIVRGGISVGWMF